MELTFDSYFLPVLKFRGQKLGILKCQNCITGQAAETVQLNYPEG